MLKRLFNQYIICKHKWFIYDHKVLKCKTCSRISTNRFKYVQTATDEAYDAYHLNRLTDEQLREIITKIITESFEQ